MKKILAIMLALTMVLALAACGSPSSAPPVTVSEELPPEPTPVEETVVGPESVEKNEFKVGICTYASNASLDQIVQNIESQLEYIGLMNGVIFEISYGNCQADENALTQIIDSFIAEEVDMMIGVSTPVAMAMQAATGDNGIPVMFAAVSDPVSAGLVESLEAPGANVTGTSDALDTTAVMKLIFAADPDADLIGLLYDDGQVSSAGAIAEAKAYLDDLGVAYVEKTGATTDEISLAADELIAAGVDAVFTPTDNTVMNAELTIYEKFIEAGVPHYAGADAFALNGALLGYGADYANLGFRTANIAGWILMEDLDVATFPVETFDNGIATVNTETCAALGWDYDEIAGLFAPLCAQVVPITTAESFY